MKGRVFLLRKRFSSSGKTCGVWDWFLLEVAKIASSRLLLLGNPTDESGLSYGSDLSEVGPKPPFPPLSVHKAL